MAHHQRHARPGQRGLGDALQLAVARGLEGRAQVQIFGRVAAQRQLGRQQQLGAIGIGLGGGVDDLLGIAGQIAHDKIQLGDANRKRHGRHWGRSGLHKLCGTRPCLRPA